MDELPNPSTPLAFLPPALANQFEVSRYVFAATLGVNPGITAPLGVHQVHIGPTMQCIDTVVPPNTEIIGTVALINDTAIFLAINYRLLAHSIAADSPTACLRVFFGGTGLSTLSQVLIESGQHFYLVAVTANVALLVLLNLPQLSPRLP
ncbi:hypothetical protein MSAN_02383700 [Mycena sanguinolenta]|uniref:Uncharacterized protein n=1 Tax=Mycena sanguinolenta TaxID=230812 RepID=A0A8H7CE38_9AGAR|nr:hypothetical protein MSAN_02383700 [Mycena sanguinolenta]